MHEEILSVAEAAPLLWYRPAALLRILQQYPRHIEHYVSTTRRDEKGLSWVEADNDPECVVIPKEEVQRIIWNQPRKERCAGCREIFAVGELHKVRAGGFHEAYACEACFDFASICAFCDEPVFEDEEADLDHSLHEWCYGEQKEAAKKELKTVKDILKNVPPASQPEVIDAAITLLCNDGMEKRNTTHPNTEETLL